MGKQNKHDKTIDWLVERLEKKGYDQVLKNVLYTGQYQGFRERGEFDVLAIRGGHAHYYEVKSNDYGKAFNRAREQFSRANRSLNHTGYVFSFVYVTPTRVRRVIF